MNGIAARERRIVALMCTLVALTCVIDVGLSLRRGQPADPVKVFVGVSLLAIAGYSLYRARRGT